MEAVVKIADQGIDPKRFQVIPRNLIFLFDSEERILLIKGFKDKERWAGVYNGIGGHMELNEDILESAQRELIEETGIEDAKIYLCGQIMISSLKNPGVALFIFKGLVEKTDIKLSREGELYWIPFDRVSDYPLVEDLKLLLPLVANHKEGNPIIIGKYIYHQQKGEFEFIFQ
jgi:8-oxo-dGTP diphosphatase